MTAEEGPTDPRVSNRREGTAKPCTPVSSTPRQAAETGWVPARRKKRAMPIRYWNKVALDANRVSHTAMSDPGTLGPPLSARALAIVHLAMYDAYAAIDPTAGAPYLPGLPTSQLRWPVLPTRR
jgi:hypothetical protein